MGTPRVCVLRQSRRLSYVPSAT